MEALGYEFEKLILYITSLGLGTCWLGGTFNKKEFAKIMDIKENEIFPIISPIGYEFDKRRITEIIMRSVAKSDKRKSWNEIFFNNDFSTTLLEENAGEYKEVLEMVRLAPSAGNKQPWRVVKKDNEYHFFKTKSMKDSKYMSFDMQRIDIGIALCHFQLSANENNLNGEFKEVDHRIKDMPETLEYVVSWIGK
ncbi:hypothetical protein D3C73_1218790 [compost metagenome]